MRKFARPDQEGAEAKMALEFSTSRHTEGSLRALLKDAGDLGCPKNIPASL
jgi:hypothetical protein